MAHMGVQPGLAGYELRVLDGNHLPGSEKRLAVLRGHRGAALPGQSIVVYDPDSGLVTDLIAGEDAHQSERTLAIPLLQGAKPGQLWIADRRTSQRGRQAQQKDLFERVGNLALLTRVRQVLEVLQESNRLGNRR